MLLILGLSLEHHFYLRKKLFINFVGTYHGHFFLEIVSISRPGISLKKLLVLKKRTIESPDIVQNIGFTNHTII